VRERECGQEGPRTSVQPVPRASDPGVGVHEGLASGLLGGGLLSDALPVPRCRVAVLCSVVPSPCPFSVSMLCLLVRWETQFFGPGRIALFKGRQGKPVQPSQSTFPARRARVNALLCRLLAKAGAQDVARFRDLKHATCHASKSCVCGIRCSPHGVVCLVDLCAGPGWRIWMWTASLNACSKSVEAAQASR